MYNLRPFAVREKCQIENSLNMSDVLLPRSSKGERMSARKAEEAPVVDIKILLPSLQVQSPSLL
jgi:hypothetical protein